MRSRVKENEGTVSKVGGSLRWKAMVWHGAESGKHFLIRLKTLASVTHVGRGRNHRICNFKIMLLFLMMP